MIAASEDDYVERAVRFAADRERLGEVRARLALARDEAPLFDARRFARALETAFEAMQTRALEGRAPADIDVHLR